MKLLSSLSFSDYVTIIGVIIGLLSLYLFLRRAKYQASLTFVREQSIGLLEDFAMKIPNLSIHYKEASIDKNIVLFSGHLVNDGSVDITREMTELPLRCVLPDGSSWLEFRVTASAPSLKIHYSIIDLSIVELRLGLFRRDESFAFQALVLHDDKQTKKGISGFADDISWDHRIAGLGNVKTIVMPNESTRSTTRQWIRKTAFVVLSIFYILSGLSQISGIGPLGYKPSILHYTEEGPRTNKFLLKANSNRTTTIKNLETGEIRIVQLQEFVGQNKLIPFWSDQREDVGLSIFLGIMMLLFALTTLYMTFSTDYKRYRIRKRVAASFKETLAQRPHISCHKKRH